MFSEEMLARLKRFNPARLVVGYSGGLDSHVLLHLAKKTGYPVVALHINHGLAISADEWQAHVIATCDDLGVPVTCMKVDVSPQGNVEGNARDARYRAFETFLKKGDVMLLAHHADDQVESALMHLFRGSNRPGVAGMPVTRAIGCANLLRPLLQVTRASLLRYARDHELAWIDDTSNADTSFNRNFIRHELLPMVQTRWPAVREAVLQAIQRDEEVVQLIDYIGEKDLLALLDERGGVSIPELWALPVTRRRNVIRYWVHSFGLPLPGGAMLASELDTLKSSRQDASPLVTWQGVCLRRVGDHIFLTDQTPSVVPSVSYHFHSGDDHSVNELLLPFGTITADPVKGKGLVVDRLDEIEIRFRTGGETLLRGNHRTLKNLFQESGVPAWLRDYLPLAFVGGELVAIVGLPTWQVPMLVAGGKSATPDQTGVELSFKMPNQPYSH